jgi:hypothetical protein
MTDQQTRPEDVAQIIEAEKSDKAAEEAAKRRQFAQTGDRIDTGLGNMGGAGASASGPDISKQSEPQPGNSSDLPRR